MSDIQIHQPHQMPHAQARAHVDSLATELAERLNLNHAWEGDVLKVNGSGLDGRITLLPDALDVAMTLGFPLSMMQGVIETRLRDALQQHFGSAA